MKAYSELETRFHRLYALRNAVGVLQWDMATKMPSGGAAARAEQMAALNVACHGVLADPAVGDLLDEAESTAPISTSGSTPIWRRCAGNGRTLRRSIPGWWRPCRRPVRPASRSGARRGRRATSPW